MEKIGFIIGEDFLYWSPIILTIAVAAAVCAFLALYIHATGKLVGGLLTAALSVALGLLLGRLLDWYCLPDSYPSLDHAMAFLDTGSYALPGIFAGCLLAAVLARLTQLSKDLPTTLDCLAVAGCLGICVGRLNHFFNPFDRGRLMDEALGLPLVYPAENAVTGQPEYRLATFMLQAIVAGALFVLLLAFFMVNKHRRPGRRGDTFLLFMLTYGASQIFLDSTRYDSLFMRSNGFVSMVMILGAVGLVTAIVLFSIRMVRRRGWHWWYLAPWVAIAGLLTCAGFMEYFVQRRGNEALYYYNFMVLCLGLTVALGLMLYVLGLPKKDAPPHWLPKEAV